MHLPRTGYLFLVSVVLVLTSTHVIAGEGLSEEKLCECSVRPAIPPYQEEPIDRVQICTVW